MSTPVPVTFSGRSTSSGTVAFVKLQDVPLALSGKSTSSGTLTLSTQSVYGAFDDFGVMPYVAGAELTDPVITGLVDITARIGGSDTANAWQRISVSARRPVDYAPGPAGQLYSRAAYARLSINTDSMPVGQPMQITGAQFEQTPGQPYPLTDFPGINLLTTEQSSYEGRLMYVPTATFQGAKFARDNSRASCGVWSGHYTYATPPAANTYQAVQGWGSYSGAEAGNATYSQLIYNVPPGTSPGTGTGQTTFTITPMPEAVVPCSAGTYIVGSLNMTMAVATPPAGHWFAEITWYNSSMAEIGTTLGPGYNITGNGVWDRVISTATAPANTAYVGLGARFIATSAINSCEWWADEHRLYTPINLNPAGTSGTSPARPWHSPRLVILRPQATRVNLCQNPGFYNDLAGWSSQVPAGVTATWTRNTTAGLGGGACGDFQIASGMPTGALLGNGVVPWTGVGTTNNPTGANWIAIDLVPPGKQATYSAYVKTVQGGLPITIWADNGNTLVRGTSAAPGNGNWTRIYVTVTTRSDYGGSAIVNIGYAASDVQRIYSACPPATNPDVWQPIAAGSYAAWSATTTYATGAQVVYTDGNSYQALVPNGPYSTVPSALEFYVDQILAEASGQLQPYFDGFTAGADYMWEPRTDTRPQTGESRSHYYLGKTVNQYRLDQALQRAIPVGSKYAVIYASPPIPQVG